VQLREIIVVKRDGKRALFDRDKVAKSVTIALRKRAVGDESVERLVSGIVRKLESSGETEVTSAEIGDLVMESLKTVDPVGYVRYASVYKDFKDPSDFARFIETSALEDGNGEE
jgi:transcriptional repressor NrdR